jgi:hypothetical protein
MMRSLLAALTVLMTASTALAQVQPGPNLGPGGRGMYTYSPRAAYIGPPVPVYPYPSYNRLPYPGYYGPPLPPPDVIYLPPPVVMYVDPMAVVIGSVVNRALFGRGW